MMKKDKTRSANFSSAEEELLTQLVKKYKSVIVNKETDAVSVRQKNEAWQSIATEFNSQSTSSYRDAQCLMRKYKNIATNLRKKVAREKLPFTDTGNGPYKEVEYSQAEKILAPLIQKQLTGNQSEFDDDNDQILTDHRLFANSASHSHPASMDEYILEEEEFYVDDPVALSSTLQAEEVSRTVTKSIMSSSASTNVQVVAEGSQRNCSISTSTPRSIRVLSSGVNSSVETSIPPTKNLHKSGADNTTQNLMPESSPTDVTATSSVLPSSFENNDQITSGAHSAALHKPTQIRSTSTVPHADKTSSDWRNWQKNLKRNSTDGAEGGTVAETFSKRRATYQDKVSQWAAAKLTLNQLQKEAFEKEQVLKRTLLENKEKTILLELVNEIKARIDCNKEEHNLKMRLLQEKHDKEIEILELKRKALAKQLLADQPSHLE